jgi:2-polyprenyl-3-methyl-5-hydroxy-6-metoxy-1,4-benzoquinol methylase
MEILCPSCRCKATKIGPLYQSNEFAGKKLDVLFPKANLYRCDACHLRFRWPRLSKNDMDAFYLDSDVQHWEYAKGSRTDWNTVYRWVKNCKYEGSVLDIGCFDGSFLESLEPCWKKYGIEINKKAAILAKNKGIEIINHDLTNLSQTSLRFDVVTAFDVIEHVENPFVFLSEISRLCTTNGVIIISTGNSDSLSWKFMGSRYWYCTISEHISFINEQWTKKAANELNLKIEFTKCFSHNGEKNNFFVMANDIIKNLLYKISPSMFGMLRALGVGMIDVKKNKALSKYPPYWLSAHDHFITILKKQDVLSK